MLTFWAIVITGVAVVFIIERFLPRWLAALMLGLFCLIAGTAGVIYFGPRDLVSWVNVGGGIWGLVEFWRNRPRGKGRKTAKLIGAKARAIRAQLIAAMPSGSVVPMPA